MPKRKTKKTNKRTPKKTKPNLLNIFILTILLFGCGYLVHFLISTPETKQTLKPIENIAETTKTPTTPTETTRQTQDQNQTETPAPTPTPAPTDTQEERPQTETTPATETPTTPPTPPAEPQKPVELPTVEQPEQPVTPPTEPQQPAAPAVTITDRNKIYQINPNLPKICIIVDDFGGIGNNLFQRFNTLDTEIAFAVLPNLRNSNAQTEQAVAKGREVIIHMPMQPINSREKLEANTIMVAMEDTEIKSQIETWMYELPKAIGANNHMGSLATADERVMHTVLSTMAQNDMFFIDSATSSSSVVQRVANSLNIKTIARDIFLDVPNTSHATTFDKVRQINNTRNKETIVVITHCHNDAKYRQLVSFVDRLKTAGYQLIPPSAAVK